MWKSNRKVWNWSSLFCTALLLNAAAACGPGAGADAGQTANDAGQTANDAGQTANDAGQTANDAGQVTADAGQVTTDAGQVTADAGQTANDAGQTANDAGQVTADAGQVTTDAGHTVVDAGQTGDAGLNHDAGAHDAGAPIPGEDGGVGFAMCDVDNGIALSPCSPDDPCVIQGETVVEESSIPDCADEQVPHIYNDNPPLEQSVQGVSRYACLFRPDGMSSISPRPLVVFLHGGSGSATNTYLTTSLREKAVTFDLTGDVARPGFALLSIQSRNLHWPYGRLNDNRHHDTLHWDVTENPDVENLDAWIDTLAAAGDIDTDRIYLIGWSEGAMLSVLYGAERHQNPTPGGNRLASASLYSGTSPFDRALFDEDRCVRDTLPPTTMPIFGISRTCDIVPCNAAQRDALWAEGSFSDVIDVEAWQEDLTLMGADPTWRLIGDFGGTQNACAVSCTGVRPTLNHLKWPNGIADNGGIDHEPDMLDFLKSHPLPDE